MIGANRRKCTTPLKPVQVHKKTQPAWVEHQLKQIRAILDLAGEPFPSLATVGFYGFSQGLSAKETLLLWEAVCDRTTGSKR